MGEYRLLKADANDRTLFSVAGGLETIDLNPHPQPYEISMFGGCWSSTMTFI